MTTMMTMRLTVTIEQINNAEVNTMEATGTNNPINDWSPKAHIVAVQGSPKKEGEI